MVSGWKESCERAGLSPPPPSALDIPGMSPARPDTSVSVTMDSLLTAAQANYAPGQSRSAPAQSTLAAAPPPATVTSPPDTKAVLEAEQAGMSQADKDRRFQAFQLTWLDADKQKMFEDLHSQGVFDVDNDLYKMWLMLKRRAMGTVTEAVDNLLEANMPKNIPYRKRKNQDRMPQGHARYDPLSDDFVDYLEETEAKRSAKEGPPALVKQSARGRGRGRGRGSRGKRGKT